MHVSLESNLLLSVLSFFIRPHHSTMYADAACSYRRSSVVRRSASHGHEPCKNGWIDQDAVWVVDSGGSKEWRHLANTIEPSACGGDAAFLSNYFDHLFRISCDLYDIGVCCRPSPPKHLRNERILKHYRQWRRTETRYPRACAMFR